MHTLFFLSEGGGGADTSLVWLLYLGAGFLFMVIIVGWLTSSVKQDQTKALHEAEKSKKK